MIAKLTYFKPSGKYYGEGTLELLPEEVAGLWRLRARVEALLEAKCLPDLIMGHSDSYTVLVETPDHPSNVPRLVHPRRS